MSSSSYMMSVSLYNSSCISHHTVSTPDVDITVPPGPLFAGHIAPLTLICNISINPATDILITAATVDVSWFDSLGTLSNDSSRVTISPISGSGLSYTTTLTIFPLHTADSTFICRARVSPPLRQQSFVTRSNEGRSTIEIAVESIQAEIYTECL